MQAEDPKLEMIPTCEEEYHPLLQPFTSSEFESAAEKSKSKAKSSTGLSPFVIGKLFTTLLPFLTIICNKALVNCTFPKAFLESAVFFLHKKGDKKNPDNFRSIALENPFLKFLSNLLTSRISDYAESNNLYPIWQFGFRKNRSTVAAASIFYETAKTRLTSKKRTYTCFVDFSKCFDTIRRDLHETSDF